MQQGNAFGMDTREIVAIKDIQSKTGINPIYVKDINYFLFLKLQNNLKEMRINACKHIIATYKEWVINKDSDIPVYHYNDLIFSIIRESYQEILDSKKECLLNKKLQDILELKGMSEIGGKTSPDVQAEMLKEDTRGKVDFRKKVDELLGLRK